MRITQLKHEFVEYIPEVLKPGILYVSVQHSTLAHSCCCGCGREVVTPLSPAAWSLIFDGASVSLHPSVGNWNLPCQSHYIIRRNQVLWAKKWSQRQIATGRARDRARAAAYFKASATPSGAPAKKPQKTPDDNE